MMVPGLGLGLGLGADDGNVATGFPRMSTE